MFTKNKIIQKIVERKSAIKRLLALILVFSVLKALVFFAPLGINEILDSVKQFGEFEYSLNLGQSLMGVFSMGFSGAYAYFIVKHKREEMIPLFHFHFFILTCCLVLAVIIFPSLLGNVYFGSIVLGIAFADQLMLSGILKLAGKNNASVIVDTGIYIVMFCIVVSVYYELYSFSNEIWFGCILLSLIFTTVFYHFNKIRGIRQVGTASAKDLYKYGVLIVICSPLLFLITSSTRLYLGYLTKYEDVGMYSFYFRIASFVLIFFRIIGILLYRKLFLDDHKKLDTYYSIIISVLFILNIILYFTLPVILNGRYDKFTDTIGDHFGLFFFCLFQVILWISVSLFEPILQRQNKMKQFFLLLLLCLVLFITALYFLDLFHANTLNNIVFLNSFFIFLLFWGQQWILRKSRVFYPKTSIVQLSIGTIFCISYFFIN